MVSDERSFDPVKKPYHYNICGEHDDDGRAVYEPIKVIEAWGLGYGFCMGNALKYVLRAPYKDSERADLEKALWYLERVVSHDLAQEPFKINGCEALDVAQAWGLDGRLEMAVEQIALNHPAAAARLVREHLVTIGMAG